MPTQTNLESPSFLALPSLNAAADGYEFGGRTPRGLDIWADGDVKVTCIGGNTKTRTFANITASGVPFRWAVQIQKLFAVGSGTTVPVASIDLLI